VRRLLISISAILIAVVVMGGGIQSPAPAEMVLVNGKILTVDANDSVAEAVAISAGKIVAVGTNAQIRARVGAQTRVIDLHGRTATPGLIDGHVHFQATDTLYNLDLTDLAIKRMDDILERVRRQVAILKPGEWVRGRGWDEGKLVEKRAILASDLDKVAPNNPVWLMQASGHYGVANTAALRLAKITRETKAPEAGTIDRDGQGNATGIMRESAASLITTLIPPLTKDQQRTGLLKIIEDFNKEGMTGAKDPGIGPEKWDLYREVLNDNKLTVRVFALWSGGTTLDSARQALARIETLPKPPQSLGDGRLISGGVKLYMDGAVLARTAWSYQEWLKAPNEKDTGNFGYPTIEPEMYKQMIGLLHNAGVHVSTHAIGDRAIDWVVDTYDSALKSNPTRGLRHGIIHASFPTDRALDTMARLQKDYDAGYPEASASFMWWLGDNYPRAVSLENNFRMKPFGAFLKKDVKWTGGSDYTVTPYPARYGLWTSVARKTLTDAMPFGVEQSVDVRAALRSYTIWAARQNFLEDRVGSIEPGKDADIAVWDRDLYTAKTDDLKDMKCELTLFQGKIVYKSPNTPITGEGQ